MRIKIISAPGWADLEKSINEFYEANPTIEILNTEINSFSNYEYWLNSNPVTMAQSWIDYVCTITYKQ